MKVPKPVKLKNGDYMIRLRLAGEEQYVTASTAKEATRQAALLKAEHLSQKNVERVPKNVRDMTISQAIDAYLEKYGATLSPVTVRGYRAIQRVRFSAYMNKPVKDIRDWQQVITDETKKVCAKTIKNAWSCVHVALEDLRYPLPVVKLPTVVIKTHPWLDAETELQPFLKAVKGNPYEIPILLGLLSLRRSEYLAVTWDNIDLKKKIIRIRGAMVPDEHNKFIYKEANKEAASRREVKIMIPQLLDALNAVPPEKRTGRVVTCHPNTVYEIVNGICEANGLPKIGNHGLRHTFVSAAFATGVPEADVQEEGGWSDPATVHKHYKHMSRMSKLKAESALESFYQSLDAPPAPASICKNR